MKVRKANTLPIELIKVRSLDVGVSMTRQIAISLVIRHDDDDVGRSAEHYRPHKHR